jgi:hypothetical protein
LLPGSGLRFHRAQSCPPFRGVARLERRAPHRLYSRLCTYKHLHEHPFEHH